MILLRRLRLSVPLVAARCRCRALHDQCGDDLAACPRSVLLKARGGPVERAAARIRREAGATVALNVVVRDLNATLVRQGDRRIEGPSWLSTLHGCPRSPPQAHLVGQGVALQAPRCSLRDESARLP